MEVQISLKAVLPVAERLATSSDCYSKTGPRSSACLILTLSQSCEVKWDCHLYGWLLISSLLMTRWHTEPGHQQAWYWLSLRVVKWSEIVTCMDGYWYQACWWPGDILSQVISRLDIDLVSELSSEARLSLVFFVYYFNCFFSWVNYNL